MASGWPYASMQVDWVVDPIDMASPTVKQKLFGYGIYRDVPIQGFSIPEQLLARRSATIDQSE